MMIFEKFGISSHIAFHEQELVGVT